MCLFALGTGWWASTAMLPKLTLTNFGPAPSRLPIEMYPPGPYVRRTSRTHYTVTFCSSASGPPVSCNTWDSATSGLNFKKRITANSSSLGSSSSSPPIGPIRHPCRLPVLHSLCFASGTDRPRRPSRMVISVYTAAALSNLEPHIFQVHQVPTPTSRRASFVTSLHATKHHFTRKVEGVSPNPRQGIPHLGMPTTDDDVTCRGGPSLPPSSLAARVEEEFDF
ncbi:hypothetical protein NA56DRAFT_698500 [Hyaloscypha hepaticicola]|uniref:Secreted protein n=1 Tax=Hyaloscypha hepaticicola TaxID=2082293 RepID=A0A2J6QJ85_9HELO|nr:hypothetical protein NA56DRAFT_698500 [Hyaloscypha hepaticicola]